jgi:AcrR family transcriptional regulator
MMPYRWNMADDARVEGRLDARRKIVEVAARLLREQGPAAVTTRGVAQAAGVQAPMIYRLFGDKDGLLDAVAEHVLAAYSSAKSAHVEAASAENVDPLEDLRDGWRAQIEFGLTNATLFALLSDPARGFRSPAARAAADVLRARVHRVASAGRLRVSEERAVNLIRAAGAGTVQTLLSMPPDDRDPGLADTMYEAVLREIVNAAPEVSDTGPVAAAVTLRALVARLGMLSNAERQLLTEWLDRAIGEQ